ncbi:MAG: ketoacyl-ACP synthase III [Victivallaceae bacterium]|nr:ketoacyl-ACP synthase III [Victivallaceae bacterium]
MSIKIIGTGSYLPEKVMTNFDLEKMVETSDEWIRTRTGIESRHLASQEQAASDLAFEAASRALTMAKTAADELDVIVVATVTPDHFFPSTGCILQRKLGAHKAFCFDLEAACSGLLYSMETAKSLLAANPRYRKALIVGAEKLSSITDWSDRNTCVLFGDGASALVLAKDDEPESEGSICSIQLHSDGNYAEILQIPAGGSRKPVSEETLAGREHFIRMAGRDVFKLAVNGMLSAGKDVMAEAGVEAESLRWMISHQANSRIINAVADRLALPEEKVFINLDHCGNTSSASIGICLDELNRSGRLSKGDYILVTAFGGGLTWGAALLRWQQQQF